MEYEILERINLWAFKNGIAYKNSINYLKNLDLSEDGMTEIIIKISRYTYTHCEESLLNDQDYDELLNLEKYEKYKKINYEEDKYDEKLLTIIKNLGLRTIVHEESGTKYKDKLSEGKIQELINMFPSNTSLMTTKNISELKNMFITPYYHNLGKIIELEKEDELDEIKDLRKLGDIGVDEKYHIPGSDNIFMSYKHDGWNITAYYLPGVEEVAYAHTRGRDGSEVRDCTHIAKRILPKANFNEETKIVFELVLDRTSLEKLRVKYLDKNFVNVRNSISTFIAGNINEKDYDCLEYFTFNISNSEYDKLDTLEKYYKLYKMGFNIPKFEYGSIEYLDKMLEYMDSYYVDNYSKRWECDGLVISMDFLEYYKLGDDCYYKNNGSALCAYKGGSWGSEVLEVVVDYLYYGKGKRRLVPKAKLRPIKSKSGSVIENVGLDNLRLVGYYYIMPGDVIRIKYHSQQIVLFVNKISGSNKGQYMKKEDFEIEKEIKSYDKYREYRKSVTKNAMDYRIFSKFSEIVENLEYNGENIIKNCLLLKDSEGYPYEKIVNEYKKLGLAKDLIPDEDMWREYAYEILYPLREKFNK